MESITHIISGPKCTVYGLSSDKDGRVRYVGQTTKKLAVRMSGHIADAKRNTRSHIPLHRWILKTLREGHQVCIRPIQENCTVDSDEVKWIASYRNTHKDLLNILDGGTHGKLGLTVSEETKQKMRKPKSEQHRKNISAGLKGKSYLKKSIAQIGNAKSRGEANRHALLTEKQVIDIKQRLALGIGCTILAKIYGVQKSAISKIHLGRTWKHIQS